MAVRRRAGDAHPGRAPPLPDPGGAVGGRSAGGGRGLTDGRAMPPPAPAAHARQQLPPTAWPYAAGQATRTPAGHHTELVRAAVPSLPPVLPGDGATARRPGTAHATPARTGPTGHRRPGAHHPATAARQPAPHPDVERGRSGAGAGAGSRPASNRTIRTRRPEGAEKVRGSVRGGRRETVRTPGDGPNAGRRSERRETVRTPGDGPNAGRRSGRRSAASRRRRSRIRSRTTAGTEPRSRPYRHHRLPPVAAVRRGRCRPPGGQPHSSTGKSASSERSKASSRRLRSRPPP